MQLPGTALPSSHKESTFQAMWVEQRSKTTDQRPQIHKNERNDPKKMERRNPSIWGVVTQSPFIGCPYGSETGRNGIETLSLLILLIDEGNILYFYLGIRFFVVLYCPTLQRCYVLCRNLSYGSRSGSGRSRAHRVHDAEGSTERIDLSPFTKDRRVFPSFAMHLLQIFGAPRRQLYNLIAIEFQ